MFSSCSSCQSTPIIQHFTQDMPSPAPLYTAQGRIEKQSSGSSQASRGVGVGSPTCDIKSCGAIDPVSDPAYNMREIAKQSILLEEHLTVPEKFCPDCCVKHLLHCHGLAIEALMLAGENVDRYPHIKEAAPLFHDLLEEWRLGANPLPVKTRLEMASKLRTFRKKLVYSYYINKEVK